MMSVIVSSSVTPSPRGLKFGEFLGGLLVSLRLSYVQSGIHCRIGLLELPEVGKAAGPVEVCIWLIWLGGEGLLQMGGRGLVLSSPGVFHAHGIQAERIAGVGGQKSMKLFESIGHGGPAMPPSFVFFTACKTCYAAGFVTFYPCLPCALLPAAIHRGGRPSRFVRRRGLSWWIIRRMAPTAACS